MKGLNAILCRIGAPRWDRYSRSYDICRGCGHIERRHRKRRRHRGKGWNGGHWR